MATLAALRNSVTTKLGLLNDTGTERDLVDQWCNEAILEILSRTHCTVHVGSMATVADVWQYHLDANILALRDVFRTDAAGAVEPVIRVTEQEILELRRGSASSNAAYTRYATIGANLIILWPTPSAAYTLNLHYVPRPGSMTVASDDPSDANFGRVPKEFHKAIEYYALWQGGEYDESRSSQGGERYRALFENYIDKVIRPSIRKKGGADQPQVRRGSWRSQRLRARENDRYP